MAETNGKWADTSENSEFAKTTWPRIVDEIGAMPQRTSGMGTLEKKLTKLFGLGDAPGLRRKLFRKLQVLWDKDECYKKAIREALAAAQLARKPDRYFCRTVIAKIGDVTGRLILEETVDDI